jgi:hypothetical protein
MSKNFLAVLPLMICPFLVAQQAMNNDAVTRMEKAGLSDDVIVATINASQGSYDTSADGLVALKNAGVTDKVISAVVAKASASAPPVEHPTINQGAISSGPVSQGTVDPPDAGTASGSAPISVGARIVIAPMGGFETYFAAAVREKKVPVTLTLDKASAQYFAVSTNTEWEGFVYGSGGSASWNRSGGSAAYGSAASSTRGLEASIMLINARTKDVVWAYEVHKNSHGSLLFGTLGARGQQSIAEACAKHLKEYVEKGR